MLNEKFGIFEFISVIVTVMGVILISKPDLVTGFLSFFHNTSNTQASYKLNDYVVKFDLNNIFNPFISFEKNKNNTENYHAFGMILALGASFTFALSNIYVSINCNLWDNSM